MALFPFFQIFFLLLQGTFSPSSNTVVNIEEKINVINIIPQPVSIQANSGFFNINKNTVFVVPTGADDVALALKYLNDKLSNAAGFALISTSTITAKNTISVTLTSDITNAEGYELSITKQGISIKAQNASGVFYAVQSIRQLLPVAIENQQVTPNIEWKIPCCEIKDSPRYAYRGLHLDVCRHFFDVNFVKKYIDLMALHKFNRFHWHLTDDQGWRIEIKKYPKLTEIAAFRKETLIGSYMNKPERFDGTLYGGFYTQEQIKEVVEYAKERFVTVVPEIEMPGHALAALAAYPELASTNGTFDVGTRWGVYDDVFCPKEETFTFLENVLQETMTLFPGEYIHIGGDECPKTRWKESEFCQNLMKKEGLKDEMELQSYIIRRIEKFVNSKGKKIIGWDEILEGGLSENATVMSWRGTEGGIAAAKQQHDAIMTPSPYCYFDHYQSKNKKAEPLAIGGFTDVEKVYSYDPTPKELSAEEAKHILGAQANLWTEYITTSDQLEYMAYPRAIALSEVVWSPLKQKNWLGFKNRLNLETTRLKALNVNFAKHFIEK
jgi:hexosaminidase